MKWEANPVIVDAFVIKEVGPVQSDGSVYLAVEDNTGMYRQEIATAAMLARMMPVIGDYWVVQEDGYVYLNPKQVFERKYHPLFSHGVAVQ
jgi:hypothetical protein